MTHLDGDKFIKPDGGKNTLFYIVWGLQILAALAFLAAGSLKLIGNPMMVEIFDKVGIGQWFRYVTGLIEVIGGLSVLISSTAPFGGVLLAITMFFATLTHLFVIGGNPFPAILLGVITATIAWLRRHQLITNTRK
jgi:putative oxidoreductase